MCAFRVQLLRAASVCLAAWAGSACEGKRGASKASAILADSLPVFIGDSLPFQYPPALYIQRVQDDVTLRLYLDEFGRPQPESTRVEEHARHAPFDTSALAGARDLVFRPALRDGKPISFPVLFPIKFRVPDGPPMPGDSAGRLAK